LNIIIKRTLYFLFSVVALSVALILLVLQSSQHIEAVHQIDANFATQNKKTLQHIIQTIKSTQQPVLLHITQNEINGLSALGHRTIPQFTSNIVLIEGKGFFRFSYELPLPNFIRFLNIDLTLNASHTGLDFDTVYIGSLPIPGNWLIALAEMVSPTYIETEFSTSLL
jgi:hypothetical protein